MTRDHKPPRQPLLWGALAFSLGLCMGARAWRPPSWWVAAVVAFVLAALWFLSRRAWLAKGLSLGAWVLLGAFLIQVRSPAPSVQRLLALADGREVTLTAHVMREGYVRSAGSRSTRESIDVETEEIESAAGSSPGYSSPVQSNLVHSNLVRAGVRLTIYEQSENSEPVARRPEDPPVPPLTYGTRLRIHASCIPRAISAIRAPSTMKATCAITASVCWARLGRKASSGCPALPAAGSSSGAREFIRASWPKFTSCGRRRKPLSWTPWCWARIRSCATPRAPSSSARALITCSWSRG